MVFNIVKKDFLLAKKYLPLMFIFAVIGPIYIERIVGFIGGGFLSFFITAFFIQFLLFNSISMSEYKYKGALYLCATPYTRTVIVKGTYLFILTVFIISSLIYTAIASFTPTNIPLINMVNLPVPNIWTVGISFFIITTFFGIMIPLQYQFGYENTKYMAMIFTFVTPFILPKIVEAMQSNINLTPNSLYWSIAAYIFSLLIGLISMLISTHIYSKKDLQ
ncbi:MAG: ABC-2 transporter permease [Firmicutes bacterium]|nr:ABC-2 transporter permease [Bacillota bacterium]